MKSSFCHLLLKPIRFPQSLLVKDASKAKLCLLPSAGTGHNTCISGSSLPSSPIHGSPSEAFEAQQSFQLYVVSKLAEEGSAPSLKALINKLHSAGPVLNLAGHHSWQVLYKALCHFLWPLWSAVQPDGNVRGNQREYSKIKKNIQSKNNLWPWILVRYFLGGSARNFFSQRQKTVKKSTKQTVI